MTTEDLFREQLDLCEPLTETTVNNLRGNYIFGKPDIGDKPLYFINRVPIESSLDSIQDVVCMLRLISSSNLYRLDSYKGVMNRWSSIPCYENVKE
jgi:hypothetical protein